MPEETSGFTCTIRSDRELVMTRGCHAPRERIFQASPNPPAIPRWWGPREVTTIVETMDGLPGGAWRFVQRDAGGNECAFFGEYLEVEPPGRLVSTCECTGIPGLAGDGHLDAG